MKLNRIVMTVVICALMTVAAYAAGDLNGSFVAKVEGKNGTQEITYTFKVDGKSLSGKISNARGDVEIKEGKVEGDSFEFSVERPGRGDQPAMTVKYTGKIDGDTLTLQAPGRGGTMEQKAERKK
jgi:hypothetical protein